MKKVDATIKIGLVATPGEESYSNNATHNALNPRTGQTHYGWTPILLATLKNLAGGANGWASDAASRRQMLADYLGPNGTNVELCVTENNTASRGKQLTSLVNALFCADSLSQLLKTEFNSFVWWTCATASGRMAFLTRVSMAGAFTVTKV